MAIAILDRQQVTAALKAAGSTDADILFARKEELLAESRNRNFLGVLPIVIGIALCLTLVGAVAGIPAILYGRRVRKQIRANIEIAESAYAEYVSAIVARSPLATV